MDDVPCANINVHSYLSTLVVIESFGNAVITILTWVDTINLIVVEYFGNASVHFPRTQTKLKLTSGFSSVFP